jgi:hypothetical protein
MVTTPEDNDSDSGKRKLSIFDNHITGIEKALIIVQTSYVNNGISKRNHWLSAEKKVDTRRY